MVSKTMMGTKAFHTLGDISRDVPDYFKVSSEDDENYYGHWVSGAGFIDVRFPKATSRELTVDELEAFDKKTLVFL